MNLISTKVHVCGAPPLCLFAFIIEPVLKLPIHRVFCEQNKLKIQTGAESAVKPSQKWTECENGKEDRVFSWIILRVIRSFLISLPISQVPKIPSKTHLAQAK